MNCISVMEVRIPRERKKRVCPWRVSRVGVKVLYGRSIGDGFNHTTKVCTVPRLRTLSVVLRLLYNVNEDSMVQEFGLEGSPSNVAVDGPQRM